MNKTPLERAEEMLGLYYEAEKKVLLGQSYEIDGRKITRANIKEIRNGIELYEGKVARLKSGRKPGVRITSLAPKG